MSIIAGYKRIKSILNNEKIRFWVIIAAIIIAVTLAVSILFNTLIKDSAENRAEEFLKKYYTINNTDIADILDNQPVDSDNTIEMKLIDVEKALKVKYGNLMTENALEVSEANRVILEGEMAAKKYGSTLKVEDIDLWDKKVSDNGDITYQYNVSALVRLNDGNEVLAILKGTLIIRNIEGVWKVKQFRPEKGELGKVMQFGKS